MRLEFLRPTADDLDDLVRMHLDERMMNTLGGLRQPEQSRMDLDRMRAHWDEHGFGLYFLRAPEDGRFLGRAGLKNVYVNGRDEVEVGYSVVAEAWGQGLATEAAQRLVQLAFEDLGLTELVSFTLPHNTASRRVMEKAGFTYERDGVYADMPHVFYRRARSAAR
ncbi:MAG: GNAT family N-acetyltransferase [Planctomycetota bacterium]